MSPETKAAVEVGARFRRDTDGHQMTVALDQGLYRHLRFRGEGSWYWYDIITTPGLLTFNGDCGTWSFSRTEDMLEFFRSGTRHLPGDDFRINPGYWAEKLRGGLTGGRDLAKRYDEDVYLAHVKSRVEEHIEDCGWPEDVIADLRVCVDEELTGDYADYHSDEQAHTNLRDFRFTSTRGVSGSRETFDFEFHDTWEWDFRGYDWSFLWACHAIVTSIEQYDALKAAYTAAFGDPVVATA